MTVCRRRNMTVEKAERPSAWEEFRREVPSVWKSMPFKGVSVSLLTAWVLLFEFLGNSTLGYIDTHSLFAWTFYSYVSSPDRKSTRLNSSHLVISYAVF